MKTKYLLLTAATAALAAATLACSKSAASPHSTTTTALEPALISKYLRTYAELVDKRTALGAPLESVVAEARLDCKSKGFDTDPKSGDGLVNLDNNGLLACVKLPKPPAAPTPTK